MGFYTTQKWGMDENHQSQMLDRLNQEYWFRIADHTMFAGRFGHKDQNFGGHTVPAHGYLFSYLASKTLNRKTCGDPRLVRVSETDNADGVREDDLYKLLDVGFTATSEDIKTSVRRNQRWYVPSGQDPVACKK